MVISAISAFSIVYFGYRGRMLIFWLIFITLMLPLEVRIVPTYAVAANVLSPYQAHPRRHRHHLADRAS